MHVITINGKAVMNLKEVGEGHIVGFEVGKGERETYLYQNLIVQGDKKKNSGSERDILCLNFNSVSF